VGRPAGFDIKPSPISWLRSYSSYLTPKLGFLSADSWAIVAIYIQNLLLNWLIILPFLAALILGVKLIAIVLVAATLEPTETTETWYKWYLPLFFGASGIVLLVMALKFVAGRRPSRQMHDTPLDLTKLTTIREISQRRYRTGPLLAPTMSTGLVYSSSATGIQRAFCCGRSGGTILLGTTGASARCKIPILLGLA